MSAIMENSPLSKYSTAFGLSLGMACVLNALLVVVKEKSPAVQATLKKMTGHHWVSHVAIVVACFFLVGWLLTKVNGGQGVKFGVNSVIGAVVGGVVLGGLTIAGFYLFAD